MNKMDIQISIIIPIYNAEKYLDACIKSVVHQSGGVFEIILVNDGSTDRSHEICSSWQQKISNIRYFYQENQGQGAARNLGVKQAFGKWLLFLDADDEMLPNAIEKMMSCINQYEDADMLFFEYAVKDSSGRQIYAQLSDEEMGKEQIMLEMTTFLWDKLIRKKLWEKCEISLTNLYGEDILPIYTMSVIAQKVQICNLPMVLHFEREDNLSSNCEKVVQICESVKHTIEQFVVNGWFQKYEYVLLSMVRKQHRYYKYHINENFDKRTREHIVMELETIMSKFFVREYELVKKYDNDDLVYIGNIKSAMNDNVWFRNVYFFDCLEKYCMEGAGYINGKCHYIINLDNELKGVMTGTRTYEGTAREFKILCEEFLRIRKQHGVYGKILLYKREKDNQLYNDLEVLAKEILGCDSYSVLPRTLEWIESVDENFRYWEEQKGFIDYRVHYTRREYNFNLMYKWLWMKTQGKKIKNFFDSKGYTNVAIYGASYIGKLLMEELKGTSVQVKYFIDGSNKEKFEGLPVYSLRDVHKDVDVIVVTVLYDFYVIRDNIIGCCPILSVESVLEWVLQN